MRVDLQAGLRRTYSSPKSSMNPQRIEASWRLAEMYSGSVVMSGHHAAAVIDALRPALVVNSEMKRVGHHAREPSCSGK